MDRSYSRRCGVHGTALWRLGGALAVAAPLLCLAACAADDAPNPPDRGFRLEKGGAGGPGGPGDHGDPGPRPSLFVSPAGEPFRSGPGEPYPVAAWFKAADTDGDGKLTRDEFVADSARFFQTLDRNHDGVIDGFELKAYETQVFPELTEERNPQLRPQGSNSSTFGNEAGPNRGRRRDPDAGQGGLARGGPNGGIGLLTQANGAAPYGLLGEREPVAGADLDINGRITLNNFKTRAAQRFAILDVDGKGYLLLPDLPKTQSQKQDGRRERGGRRRPPGGG